MKDVKQKEHMRSAKTLETSQRIPRHANLLVALAVIADNANGRKEISLKVQKTVEHDPN